MKVLWITNIAIPQIAEAVGMKKVPVGGWMVKLADEIANTCELTLAFPYIKEVSGTVGNLKYYGFPNKKNDVKKAEYGVTGKALQSVVEAVKPDVIHIHGTECIHSYIMSEVCKKLGMQNRVVISIQGLLSVYADHYEAYLPHNISVRRTLRDWYAGNVAFHRKKFYRNGEYEKKAITNVQHVIGRTDWDKACCHYINPNAQYHFCNEMLRASFYEHTWNYEACEKHSIFMSQATNPIKGLHLGVEAFTLVKRDYPDAKLYIAGKSYYGKPKWKLSYYEKYVLELIEKNNLRNDVIFTGFLDEEAMCRRYLKSNVFVSASSIENSPNSVCEAMALGMPVVSSMVGGVANLLKHGEEGFYYQADAPYMLAYYIKKFFDNKEQYELFAYNAKKVAHTRHAPGLIVENLTGIYHKIKECRNI